MKNIENYKNSIIALDEIENFYNINEYDVLYKTVNELINDEKLSPVKASGSNGRKPEMYKKYRIIRKEEDFSSYLDEINFKLCTEFDVSYYKKHLNKYKENRKYILMLNEFLLNKRDYLKSCISMNERSFQIWNREKFLQKEEGKTILKNLGIDLKILNYYDKSEPLAYYSKTKKKPQNVLIIENKDTYYTFRKHLIKNKENIFDIEIDTVIYGAGKNIIKAIDDFHISVEEHVCDKRNTIYYFGDLDYEGILIYEKFYEKMSKSYKVKPFIEAYVIMIKKYENLKMTIHEIIFKLHLDKASYDKAVDDIKNIFNMMGIRVQSMDDAIRKIRENLTNNIDNDETSIINIGNVDFIIAFNNRLLNENELLKIIDDKKNELSKIKSDEGRNENSLQRAVYKIQSNDEFKDESFFKEPIETLLSLVSKPHEFNDQLNMINESYYKLMEKLSCDINLIEEEQNNILGNLLDYIEIIHDNISKIDNNSSINIKDKRIKMLNIVVPEWSSNEDIYKVKLKNYIEQLRNQCIVTLENNESIEEIISNTINTSKLYDEVVSLSSINIKLYKIEEDKQRQISWNEVSSNSGGEGFLSAFVILSSLLSYMRKDENDIFSRKEEGKVLIMDNPFAQTNAAHLLKPLMDVAKKSNTQLICLTGLGGDSIYNRFDNIYVLKLISSKIKTGVKYLKSEHAKGEEDNKESFQIMDSARFKIEETEQTRLF